VLLFGPAALAVSPRIGHIHVTVDDVPWVWADAGGEPLILNGLPPGPHKILNQVLNANHQPIEQARSSSGCLPRSRGRSRTSDRSFVMKNQAFGISVTALISGVVAIASGTGDEGRMPDLDGAVAWLNSTSLSSQSSPVATPSTLTLKRMALGP
jgi:hypothetical protein